MECKEDIDLFVDGIGGNVVCSVLSSYGRGYRALLMEYRALLIECTIRNDVKLAQLVRAQDC